LEWHGSAYGTAIKNWAVEERPFIGQGGLRGPSTGLSVIIGANPTKKRVLGIDSRSCRNELLPRNQYTTLFDT